MSGVSTQFDDRRGGRVARVVIDNESKLNILGADLMDRLLAELVALAPLEDLRAVVLTGAGTRAFVGGADIAEMARLDAVTGRAFIGQIHRICEAIRRLPVPVIARIQGYALGGGLEIAAACDLRIAADDAKFGMPEVRIGIPSVVEAALLPLLVGWGRARQILLLGEIFSAADAEKWGLVERVVPAGELDAAVERWLDAILACGPLAIRAQKRLMTAWEDLPLRDAVAAGIEAFVASWQTDEPRQAMEKFLTAQAARRRG
jgi:enoyl-CoA hydratase